MAVDLKSVSKIHYLRQYAASGFIRTYASSHKIIPDLIFQLCVLFYGDYPSLIEQVDNALSRFYGLKGIEGYRNDDGDGKFKEFCDDNGLEDDEQIRDEMDDDIVSTECVLIDFDEDLFDDKGYDDERRAGEIWDLLKECIDNKYAFMDPNARYGALCPTEDDWYYLDPFVSSAKQNLKLYDEQCPLISHKIVDSSSLKHVLLMNYKLGKPYLQYVADMYNRERIDHRIRRSAFDVKTFASTNVHLKELKDMKALYVHPFRLVQHALFDYFRLINPVIQIPPMLRIMDSLSEVSQWIAATVSFVHGLATKAAPFQFDATFAFSKIRILGELDYESVDPFGDVKSKLANNKLLSVQTQVTESSQNGYLGVLQEQFEKFKDEQINKKYKGDEAKNYPHKHRFCAFIDRRKPNDAENVTANDELIIYEPPKDCNKFPKKQHLPLFYFETARKCIIPSHGYSKGQKNGKHYSDKTIHTGLFDSGIMILSFHVEAKDEIRCYLHIVGQSIRFMPNDIVSLLPMLFDSAFEDNKKFRSTARTDENRELVDDLSQKLKGTYMSYINTKSDVC